MVMDKTPENKANLDKSVWTRSRMVSFASEFGFVIALPLVIFVFLGRWLDACYGTEKLFVLLGILLALISSIIYLSKRINNIRKTIVHADKLDSGSSPE